MPGEPDGPVGAALVDEEPHRAGGLLDRPGAVLGRHAGAPDARGAEALPPRRDGRQSPRSGREAARRSGPRADRGSRPCAAARWRRGAGKRRDCAPAARRSPRRRARRSRRPARPRSRRRNRPARSPSIRPGAAHGSRSHHGRSRCLAMKAVRRRPHVAVAGARPPIYREWRRYCTVVHQSQGAVASKLQKRFQTRHPRG